MGFSPSNQVERCKACSERLFWKASSGCFFRSGSVYPGLYSRAPVLPLGSSSGGTAQMELYTPSCRGRDMAKALAAIDTPFSHSFDYQVFSGFWGFFYLFF